MRAATQSDGKSTSRKSGDNSEEVTPVPISNTVVKHFYAGDRWLNSPQKLGVAKFLSI